MLSKDNSCRWHEMIGCDLNKEGRITHKHGKLGEEEKGALSGKGQRKEVDR